MNGIEDINNTNLQNCNSKEESTIEDEFNHVCTSPLTVNNSEENLVSLTKNSENKMHCDSNIMEANENDGSKPVINEQSTNEHSYANVNGESVVADDISINVNTTISEQQLLISDTPMVILEICDQKQNDCDILKDNLIPAMNNEIVIIEEIINIDNHIEEGSSTTNKANTENTNLNNENINNKKPQDLYFIDNKTSLDKIALQYDSSDAEDDENTKTAKEVSNSEAYRNKEVVLASDESADSENDSSSSDSESDSDSSSCSSSKNSSDSNKKVKSKGNRIKKDFKQKNEFDDLPPIEDLKISVPEVLCDPLGEVAWTVEQMVVVRPKPGKPTLNLDTVLFIDKGQRALGHIFDVFGQVAEPHYCVRFNSSDHIRESDVKIGMTVYYCPNTPYTSLVFLSELTKMKAADDVGEDEPPQFSDDEEEQAYLANLRNKSNSKAKDTSCEVPNKRRRDNKSVWQSNHPWNNNRNQQQNRNPHNPKPFYRTQHPWSRPRHQPHNPWHQYNSFANNPWMNQFARYNEMQTYIEYLTPVQVQQIEMQNVGIPPVQWNPHYQLPQFNPMPIQGFPQTIVPPFTLPPPPPPPPPNADM